MIPTEILNAEDVARILHLGKNTVYQLAKTGQLESYRVGRKLRFTREAVDAFVTAGQTGGTGPIPVPDADELANAAAFGQLSGQSAVIAGGDAAADLLAGLLNAAGKPTQRLVCGSYTALVNLYAGQAEMAIVHLYDQRTNSYNVPYVRNLAPGSSSVVIRLYSQEQGFVVQAGNPKHLSTWGSLLHEGVRLANRRKGSAARVLLDEKLQAMDARGTAIDGYETEAALAGTAIQSVAEGLADVAIGTQREAAAYRNVRFIPLQTEWVDAVIAKEMRTRELRRAVNALVADGQLRSGLESLGYAVADQVGAVVYES